MSKEKNGLMIKLLSTIFSRPLLLFMVAILLGKGKRHLCLPGTTLNPLALEKGTLLDGFLVISFVVTWSDTELFCLLTQ